MRLECGRILQKTDQVLHLVASRRQLHLEPHSSHAHENVRSRSHLRLHFLSFCILTFDRGHVIKWEIEIITGCLVAVKNVEGWEWAKLSCAGRLPFERGSIQLCVSIPPKQLAPSRSSLACRYKTNEEKSNCSGWCSICIYSSQYFVSQQTR